MAAAGIQNELSVLFSAFVRTVAFRDVKRKTASLKTDARIKVIGANRYNNVR